MVCVQVPASSANLGAGFDSLGVALSLYNYVWFEESKETLILNAGQNRPLPSANNLIYHAACAAAARAGRAFTGLTIIQQGKIPVSRGLGSSAACVAAGLVGANALLGNPLTMQQLVDLACEIEGHPDNATAALTGGFTVSVRGADGQVEYSRFTVRKGLRFAAFIPPGHFRTRDSRKLLPETVSMEDCVYNLSRAALMTACLATGQTAQMRVAAQDRIHQNGRLAAIKGGEQLFALCDRLGAHAVYLSGAGSTIMALFSASDRSFKTRAVQALHEEGLPWFRLRVLSADNSGARLTDKPVPCAYPAP